MKFIETFVTRRVTVTMIYALVFLLGFIAWNALPREFMPNLEFPQLMVITNYENASSQEVENLVTKVIEEACGTVKGVRQIHSVSKEGLSLVTVEFTWGVNMDFASLNLREKVDLVKVKLPRDAGEPQIEKFNPFALPVIMLSLTGDRPPQELLKVAKRPVTELLEKVPGVAAVSLTGGLEREIRVELDQSKLANYKVPVLKVAEAVDRSNVTYPAGTIQDDTYEYVVRVLGAFSVPREIESVVVKVDRDRALPGELRSYALLSSQRRGPEPEQKPLKGSPLVMLSSLGTVTDTFQERTSFARYDGRENISLAVLKQGEANIVEVAAAVKRRLEDIRSKLPQGVELTVVYDQSTFIENGISDMVHEGLMGALLAFVVLFVFLGSWKDALVVNAVIPTSILITVFLLYLNGITVNTISLAGLVVGLGLLTDGAIVVVENVSRHKEEGEGFLEASAKGAQEVFGAVASSVGSQIVVFFPLIFVVGIIGQVFRDLSMAIVYTQVASLIVYFTLLPMLCGLIPLNRKSGLPLPAKAARAVEDFNGIYDRALKYAFDNPGRAVLYAVGACMLSVALLFFLPRELFPKVDQGQFLLNVKMPVGTKLEVTNTVAGRIERAVAEVPEVLHRSVTVGSVTKEGLQPLGQNEAQIVIDLKEERRRSTDRVMQDVKKRLEAADLLGGRVVFSQQQGGSFGFISGGGSPVSVEIKGYDLGALHRASEETKDLLKRVKGVYNVTSSLNLSSQEIGIDIDRDRLASYGLSVTDIANTLLTAVKGKAVSKFREEGREVDIRVRLAEADRNDLRALGGLLIASPIGIDVPLEAVAALTSRMGPSEIVRYDQQRTVIVSAGLFNRSLNSVKPELEALLKTLRANNPALSLTLSGEATQLSESFSSLQLVLLLSVMLVYMIMAAQFESFWQPFLIMLTIPLSLIGMAPALLVTGKSLSVMAGVGLVLLCGIVVNNGIILIDFVNQETERGKTLREALWSACHIRLRPIMMTACTTVFGLLPLAIGFGRESQMQSPMAIVVVSGFFVSTCLTLLVLPALFILSEERLFKKKNEGRGTKDEGRNGLKDAEATTRDEGRNGWGRNGSD